MEWVQPELILVFCPAFADVFVRREPSKGFEALREVVGSHEGLQVLTELVMALVMIAPDGGLFQRPVHPFDLTVRPGMLRLCQPVLDAIFPAAHVEHVSDIAPSGTVRVSRRESELDAVISQDRMDFVRNRSNE